MLNMSGRNSTRVRMNLLLLKHLLDLEPFYLLLGDTKVEPHPAVLSAYPYLCAQGLLFVVFGGLEGDHTGY